MTQSRTSGMLVLGILFFVLAGIFAGVAIMYLTTLQTGIEGSVSSNFSPVMLDTTTPTTVALGPGKYGIWTDNPSAATSGEEPQPTFELLDSPAEVDTQPFQDIADDTDSLPEIAITGPTKVHVAKTFGEVRVQQERQIASFEVTEAGEYTVSVTLPEGDDSDWNYSIGRDTFAVMGGVTQGILQFVMVVLGGSCGGVFGFIGLILVMIHVLRN